jgi:hypothetical protein
MRAKVRRRRLAPERLDFREARRETNTEVDENRIPRLS